MGFSGLDVALFEGCCPLNGMIKPSENHRKMVVEWDLMVFKPLVIEHNWLVVCFYSSVKYEFVNWDDCFQRYGKIKNVPNHQPGNNPNIDIEKSCGWVKPS